jgi:magnesium transporter
MNFVHMPELDEWWGYPLAWTVIVLASLTVYRMLRKRGWI